MKTEFSRRELELLVEAVTGHINKMDSLDEFKRTASMKALLARIKGMLDGN